MNYHNSSGGLDVATNASLAAGIASGVVFWQTRFRATSTVDVAAGLDGSARLRVTF